MEGKNKIETESGIIFIDSKRNILLYRLCPQEHCFLSSIRRHRK